MIVLAGSQHTQIKNNTITFKCRTQLPADKCQRRNRRPAGANARARCHNARECGRNRTNARGHTRQLVHTTSECGQHRRQGSTQNPNRRCRIAARLQFMLTFGLAERMPENEAATAPAREVTQTNSCIQDASADNTEDKDPHKIQIADAEPRPGFNLR